MPIIISRPAVFVAQRKRISADDALVYVYSSPMYKPL